MVQYKKINGNDVFKIFYAPIIIWVILLVLALGFESFMEPLLYVVLLLGAIFGGLVLITVYQAIYLKKIIYRCSKCGSAFKVGLIKQLLTPWTTWRGTLDFRALKPGRFKELDKEYKSEGRAISVIRKCSVCRETMVPTILIKK